MLHLSNISINPEYIVLIKWQVTLDHEGNSIQPSIAVYLKYEHTRLGLLEPLVIYLPEDSPNARLLREWRIRIPK